MYGCPGARWGGNGFVEDEPEDLYDVTGIPCGGYIMESHLKELLPAMPIVYFKAVVVQETWEAHQVNIL